MCTRQLPYEGMNPISIGIKVLEGMRPTMPEYVPAPIAEIISVCWAANPDDRPVFTGTSCVGCRVFVCLYGRTCSVPPVPLRACSHLPRSPRFFFFFSFHFLWPGG